eukprot:11368362-Karenia_brevis.AAC.1
MRPVQPEEPANMAQLLPCQTPTRHRVACNTSISSQECKCCTSVNTKVGRVGTIQANKLQEL